MRNVFIICLLLILSGCRGKKERLVDYFPKLEEMDAVPVAMQRDSLRDPDRIVYVNGGLVFRNKTYPRFLTAFSTDGKWLGDFLNRGQGPDEYIDVGDVKACGGEIQLYDGMRRVFAVGGLDFQMRQIPIQVASPLVFPFRVEPAEGNFIVSGIIEGGSRFLVVDSSGNAVSRFGEYGELPNHKEHILSDAQNAMAFSAFMDYNEAHKVLAVADKESGESVRFYDLSHLDAPKLMREYTHYMDALDFPDGGGITIDAGKLTSCVVATAQCGDYYLLLYCNHKPNLGFKRANVVLFFDWQGNPVKGIRLKKEYMSMTCSDSQLFLLGVDDETGEYTVDAIPLTI